MTHATFKKKKTTFCGNVFVGEGWVNDDNMFRYVKHTGLISWFYWQDIFSLRNEKNQTSPSKNVMRLAPSKSPKYPPKAATNLGKS